VSSPQEVTVKQVLPTEVAFVGLIQLLAFAGIGYGWLRGDTRITLFFALPLAFATAFAAGILWGLR